MGGGEDEGAAGSTDMPEPAVGAMVGVLAQGHRGQEHEPSHWGMGFIIQSRFLIISEQMRILDIPEGSMVRYWPVVQAPILHRGTDNSSSMCLVAKHLLELCTKKISYVNIICGEIHIELNGITHCNPNPWVHITMLPTQDGPGF